jgi:hypothetical protein
MSITNDRLNQKLADIEARAPFLGDASMPSYSTIPLRALFTVRRKENCLAPRALINPFHHDLNTPDHAKLGARCGCEAFFH